jgi:DNA-binding response OmpR family regulator
MDEGLVAAALMPQVMRRLRDMLYDREMEALARLMAADGEAVPFDRLCYRVKTTVRGTEGEWLDRHSASTLVARLRRKLGRDSVLTINGHGWALGKLDLKTIVGDDL